MKALVLCGGMSQLYLINILKERNIVSVLADMNENAPAVRYADKFYPVSTLDMEGIRQIAQREKVDCILSVCADQMLLVAAKVSEDLGLPCYIDHETAKNVSNKEYMKELFVKNDIPTAKHIVRSRFEPSDIEKMKFPLVVKPVDAYSSRGVKKVGNLDELNSAFSEAVSISRNGNAIIEEYVSGDELSVDYYVEDGIAKILCIRVLDKIPYGNGFIICRGRYPAPISNQAITKVQEIGQRIAEAFELKNTPMLVQMKLEGEQVSVIEFCARTGGGIKYRLLPIISKFDVVAAVLDLTLGNKPHYDGFHIDEYIVDEFIYCKPGEFDHLEGFQDLLDEGVIDHFAQFKNGGHVFHEIKSSGDRVAYFSVKAKSYEELEEKHKIAASRVRAISIEGNDLICHDIIRLADH